MDKIAAVRAGLIRVEHRQEPDHRVPCSLCGMLCDPDKLTQICEGRFGCPECFVSVGWYTMSHEEYFKRLRELEERKNAENISRAI